MQKFKSSHICACLCFLITILLFFSIYDTPPYSDMLYDDRDYVEYSTSYIPKNWKGIPISYSNHLFIQRDSDDLHYYNLLNVILDSQDDSLLDIDFWDNLTKEYENKIGWNGIFDAIDESGFDNLKTLHKLGELFFSHFPNEDPKYLIQICSRDILHYSPLHGVTWSYIISIINEGNDFSLELFNDACYYKYTENAGEIWISCVHGIGHGIADYFSKNSIDEAIEVCKVVDDIQFQYACASGVYMNSGKFSKFYPCDQNQYPSVCFRFLSDTFETLSDNNIDDPCSTQKDLHHNLGCIWGYAYTKLSPRNSYFEFCEQYLPDKFSPNDDIDSIRHAVCLDGYFSSKVIFDKDKISCEILIDYPLSYETCNSRKNTDFTKFTFIDESSIFYNTPLLESFNNGYQISSPAEYPL